jgi:ribosomal protein S27E
MLGEVVVYHRGNRSRIFSVPLESVSIALCGDILALASGDMIHIWDVPSRSPLFTLHQKSSQVEDLVLKVDLENKKLELLVALETGFKSISWDLELAKVAEECGKCYKQAEKLLKCGRCGEVKYCSVDCQKADWSFHKLFCEKK